MLGHLALSILTGLFVGVSSGLLGIGGGTILVPVFRLLFGMSAMEATGTSLFSIVPTSASGTAAHVRRGTCIPRLGFAMGLGGALTSPLGVFLASKSPGWAIMLVAAAIISTSAYSMFRKALALPGGKHSDASGPEACVGGEAPRPAVVGSTLLKGAAIGLVAGLASGYVGVGGGFVMMPMMIGLLGIPMALASGTSLIAVTILAIPGVIEQGLMGNVDILAGIFVSLGTVPGAYVGARLIKKIPERVLRLAFGGFLIVASVLLVANEFFA
ncbi:MAG: sulfite exporter TauE/SafE family protein [Berryella intestinalis]|uniref:sulfite exporter TauE/SafE family protein n=1 Tax=Berryella intestinalis TaxID=1531429 RepID=UPI002A5766DC|nr:sulfite exporter TauE/SafE family protein [Berryella intestinalis]MDD7369898.1 sulfite exporter TauE/SafE family protein [Berryella intestinalis]MDY3128810.1 sulfite exporter TauE/SafE family protein [Berryella intestinalis]